MSLTNTNMAETVKKQFCFKLKANIDSFSSLVFIQLLAVVFSSFSGVATSGMSSEDIQINVNYYSADLVIPFTFIWAFTTAITITTRPYRNHDFTFISNRLSSSLSNILFLAAATILGSITALLAGNLLKLMMYFRLESLVFSGTTSLKEVLIGIFVTFLYVFLFSAVGYFVGTLVQLNKLFSVLIPVLFFSSLFFGSFILGFSFLTDLFQFYGEETVLSIFIMKTLVTVAVFFIASTSIWNQLEVRR
ncbi:hypothetical protein [Ammoniphilus resinae]|nr:hypothetical protein [Ammoniphilus resinae]